MTQIQDPPSVKELADRIEIDIRARGLRPGERYMTADEAGGVLGVSVGMAHRAMRLLAEGGKLVRRRNVGTFVGPHLSGSDHVARAAICLFMPGDSEYRAGLPFDELIHGIVSGHVGAHVHLMSLPAERADVYIDHVLRGLMDAGPLAGVVPISCPPFVTDHLSRLPVPMVVLGSLYATQQNFASIDVDNREAGRLAVACLAERGRRRIALMMAGSGRPGDDAFLDGVTAAMSEAGISVHGLIVRISPPDRDGFRQQVRSLLAGDAPDAMIVRSQTLTETALEVMDDLAGPRPDIVAQTTSASRLGPPVVAIVKPAHGMQDIGRKIASMLRRMGDDAAAEPEHVLVAVRLIRGG